MISGFLNLLQDAGYTLVDDEVENDLAADCVLFKGDPLADVEIVTDDEGDLEILWQPVEESTPFRGCLAHPEKNGCGPEDAMEDTGRLEQALLVAQLKLEAKQLNLD